MHLLLLLIAATCVLEKHDSLGPDGPVAVKAETVVSGLEVPWGLAFLPGGDVLVSERPGRLRLIHEGKLVEKPVATIKIGESSEGGLLGIAIDPRDSAKLFLYATVPGPSNELQQWKLAKDHRSATYEKTLLAGVTAYRYHNGGRLRFGPDGALYLGTGDAWKPDRAQDPQSPNGKILRFTSDGAHSVFVLGVRNVEAFDWLDDGRMIIADHGPSGELGRYTHDRVLVAQKGDNLGWPKVYGCDSTGSMLPPLLSVEAKSMPPGGGAIYRGSAFPEWRGSFLIGTLASELLMRVEGGSHEVYFRQKLGRLREVAMTPEGELWMTTSNCDSRGECGAEKDRVLRVVRQ